MLEFFTKINEIILMMKNLLQIASLLAVSSITLIPNKSIANEVYKSGAYAALGAGAGTWSDLEAGGATQEFDAGFSYEGTLGYDFGKNFRTDITYSSTTSSTTINAVDSDVTFKSFMANVYVDFPIDNSKFAPFLGFGIGSTAVDVEETCTVAANTDCTDSVFTYGLNGGISYTLNPSTDIYGKITYLGFSDITITNLGAETTIQDSETLSAYIGLKFNF